MEQNLDFSFLTEEQVNNSNILKDYGTKASITDFAILLGGFVSDDYTASDGKKTGCWWTSTGDEGDYVKLVDCDGMLYSYHINCMSVGFRPTLPYSEIKAFVNNIERKNSEIIEVECFLYPQTICSARERNFLEDLYQNGILLETGKTYTTNSVDCYISYICNNILNTRKFIEYEYKGKKYIRFIANQNINVPLSDGTKIKEGCPYWIKVEPIKFLVDEKKDEAIIKDIIVTGIKFNNEKNYEGNFTTTEAKNYLDTYFSKDIIPSHDALFNVTGLNYDIFKILKNVTGLNYEIFKTLKINPDEYLKKILDAALNIKDKEERNLYLQKLKQDTLKEYDKLKNTVKENVYSKGVNVNDRRSFSIKLTGLKEEILEEIKKLNQDKVKIEVEENKKVYRVKVKKIQK